MSGTSLTFSSGASRTQSFEVPIINDGIAELQETIILHLTSTAVVMKSGVQLSLIHQERTRIVLGAVIASVVINDDDCKSVKFCCMYSHAYRELSLKTQRP